ncbi:MAG: 50S ribosome-binding GTPase [Fusobacteria bacterium]|nr:50S ribosome-binding GTPase [Fusobacteriota bacterium]
MSKIHCPGCGVRFQIGNKEEVGYIHEDVLLEDHNPICERCYKLKHYSQNILIQNNREETIKEVKQAVGNSKVVLYVVEIFDFEVSFDTAILEMLKNKKVILIITKIDLLKIHPTKIAAWVKERVRECKLDILEMAFISNISQYGINGVVRKIEKFYENNITMSVIGVTNSGKSSFIQNLLGGKTNLTISKFSGTTLKNVSQTMKDHNYKIIDTPGIIAHDRVIEHVCSNCAVKLTPTKLKVNDIKIKRENVFAIGGLAKVVAFSSHEETCVFEMAISNHVKTLSFNRKNWEKIDAEYIPEKITPPCEICKKRYTLLDKKTEKFFLKKGEELYIGGLAFIHAKYHAAEIEIEVPANIKVVKRNSLLRLSRVKVIR